MTDTLCKGSPVFLYDGHLAALHLDAWLDVQHIRPEGSHCGAAAALFHVVQPVKEEAGLYPGDERIQCAYDLRRWEALFRHSCGGQHHMPLAGGEVL